jgi:type I restriction enzyme, S subunit
MTFSGEKPDAPSGLYGADVVAAVPEVMSEQKSIAAMLQSMTVETQRLASIYECKLAALEELKKSLLHRAFTEGL